MRSYPEFIIAIFLNVKKDKLSVTFREEQREHTCAKLSELVPLSVLSFELISDP